ncbi:MAG: double zinc ribbon domain-containing protein, partial [Candidatus Helarchaeota archaeon]
FCPECWREIMPDDNYCENCGTKIK